MEAFTLGLGVVDIAKNAITQSGNIQLSSQTAERVIDTEPIPVEQKQYEQYVLGCVAPGNMPLEGPLANFKVKWKGSPYGEIKDAHIELDL